MEVTAISIYPVKSCASVSRHTSHVDARGLVGDRRWMIVDESGRFMTAREHPSLVRVDATLTDGGLALAAPGMEPLSVPTPRREADSLAVSVWKDDTTAADAGDEASGWISRYLERSCRLVFQRGSDQRPIDSRTGGQPGDAVSFADGYPLLLIGTASLEALNQRLERPVTMERFRPNLVVTTQQPFIEDTWSGIRIGDVEFSCAKRCARCVLTTVDPATGRKDPQGEPMTTLRTFRFDRGERGILFGINLIPRSQGALRLGEPCLPVVA